MSKQPNYIDKTYVKFEQIFNAPPVKPQRAFAPPINGQRIRPPQNVPPMPANMGRVPQVNAPISEPVQQSEMPMEQQYPFAMRGKTHAKEQTV